MIRNMNSHLNSFFLRSVVSFKIARSQYWQLTTES